MNQRLFFSELLARSTRDRADQKIPYLTDVVDLRQKSVTVFRKCGEISRVSRGAL